MCKDNLLGDLLVFLNANNNTPFVEVMVVSLDSSFLKYVVVIIEEFISHFSIGLHFGNDKEMQASHTYCCVDVCDFTWVYKPVRV